MFETKIWEALDSYKLLKSSVKDDDQRLISMIDNDIKELFDHAIHVHLTAARKANELIEESHQHEPEAMLHQIH